MSVNCRADKSVWWVGIDGIVYRSNGYNPQRVSTHAIEAIIGSNTVGLHAVTHPYRGHWFYCLTTADNRTLVYDVATKVWHERSTSTDGSAPWQTTVAAVDNNSIHLLGDRASGMLYTLGMQATDAGVAVIRQATLPPLWATTRRAFCARVEIEMEVGGANTPGPVLLEWSDDGSRTWGPQRTLSAGAPNELRHRVFTTRLGSFRQRTFRINSHAGSLGFTPWMRISRREPRDGDGATDDPAAVRTTRRSGRLSVGATATPRAWTEYHQTVADQARVHQCEPGRHRRQRRHRAGTGSSSSMLPRPAAVSAWPTASPANVATLTPRRRATGMCRAMRSSWRPAC